VLRSSTGSGRAASTWSRRHIRSSPNGLYEAKWGINISANIVARQGFAEPFFQSNVATGDPSGRKTVLLVPKVDDFRLPAVTSLDDGSRGIQVRHLKAGARTSTCSTC